MFYDIIKTVIAIIVTVREPQLVMQKDKSEKSLEFKLFISRTRKCYKITSFEIEF